MSLIRGITLCSRIAFSSSGNKRNIMQLNTPEFHKLFTPELNKLRDIFQKYGHELRIAGGAVRDLLLDKDPNDVDFATTAVPQEMKDMFNKEEVRMINLNGEKHGTITCRLNDKENFEITTLRIDVVTDGRHAEVEFTKDWKLDAERRDLTINSMFLGLDGTLCDYFNGESDLKERKIRFVGDPNARIQEDYLRILRYFRFYGRVAEEPNCHETATLTSIRQNMNGLKNISGERIWMELKKILNGNHAPSLIKVMIELGMAPYIGFPHGCDVDQFEKVWEECHHLDPMPMTLLATLLTTEEEIYQLHTRLKLSREELRLGLFILKHREDTFGSDVLRYCQDLMCDTVGKETKTKEKIMELLKYCNFENILKDFQHWDLPKFPVNGIMLLEKGVEKGPKFAKTLAALREKWKESSFKLTEKELLQFVDEIQQSFK